MPHFYFDVTQCGDPVADTNGRELPDLAAARKYALRALHHLADHHCSDEMFCDFSIRVRDGAGRIVLSFWLEVQTGERLERNSVSTRELEVETGA